MAGRWIVNRQEKTIIHDGWNIDERCNIDDIKEKNKAHISIHLTEILDNYASLCRYCFRGER